MKDANVKFRLQKAGENEIHGPFNKEDLIQLVNTARISPEDKIATSESNWVAAPEVEFLEMVWKITLENGGEYGPTAAGTLREFVGAGELSEEEVVVNVFTGEVKKVRELMKDSTPKRMKRMKRTTQAIKAVSIANEQESVAGTLEDSTDKIETTIEIARDLRIRQLETDLNELTRKYEELLQNYRRASQELLRVKTK